MSTPGTRCGSTQAGSSGGAGPSRGHAPRHRVASSGPKRWIASVLGACLLLLGPPAQAAWAQQQCAAGYVRLTFDDGPSATATPEVLDTLAERGAVATFFVTGQATAARPDIVRRARREGHRIGNHSWSHPRLTTLDRAQVVSQLRRTQEAIKRATGESPREWRPPYGETNDLVDAAAREVGLDSMVLWTVDPRDWADPPATTVRDRVLQAVRPGSIVILHDATGRNTPAALPMILDGLAERGTARGDVHRVRTHRPRTPLSGRPGPVRRASGDADGLPRPAGEQVTRLHGERGRRHPSVRRRPEPRRGAPVTPARPATRPS